MRRLPYASCVLVVFVAGCFTTAARHVEGPVTAESFITVEMFHAPREGIPDDRTIERLFHWNGMLLAQVDDPDVPEEPRDFPDGSTEHPDPLREWHVIDPVKLSARRLRFPGYARILGLVELEDGRPAAVCRRGRAVDVIEKAEDDWIATTIPLRLLEDDARYSVVADGDSLVLVSRRFVLRRIGRKWERLPLVQWFRHQAAERADLELLRDCDLYRLFDHGEFGCWLFRMDLDAGTEHSVEAPSINTALRLGPQRRLWGTLGLTHGNGTFGAVRREDDAGWTTVVHCYPDSESDDWMFDVVEMRDLDFDDQGRIHVLTPLGIARLEDENWKLLRFPGGRQGVKTFRILEHGFCVGSGSVVTIWAP